jgi:hypothetical protein
MFLSTSQWESFGIYYLELLCSGVVGVFQDRPWVRELLPGYRYIVSTKELVSTLQHVRENYDEARAYLLAEVIPQIRKAYDLKAFCQGLLDAVTAFDQTKE